MLRCISAYMDASIVLHILYKTFCMCSGLENKTEEKNVFTLSEIYGNLFSSSEPKAQRANAMAICAVCVNFLEKGL